MSTTLKIICAILVDRINNSAEAAGHFSLEVVTSGLLLEALKRHLAHLPALGLFFNLEKVYDMVPYESLFLKLQ